MESKWQYCCRRCTKIKNITFQNPAMMTLLNLTADEADHNPDLLEKAHSKITFQSTEIDEASKLKPDEFNFILCAQEFPPGRWSVHCGRIELINAKKIEDDFEAA